MKKSIKKYVAIRLAIAILLATPFMMFSQLRASEEPLLMAANGNHHRIPDSWDGNMSAPGNPWG
ncbi:MAG: hypothetical protein FWC71_06160 [Defluviitaleaceae bacterium]|nr:hypothetical protein [Defluviitaleaceae bacterium]